MLLEADREYLFEQAIPFFISYVATVSTYSPASAYGDNSETDVKARTFTELKEIVKVALQHIGWNEHEKLLLGKLRERADEFLSKRTDVPTTPLRTVRRQSLTNSKPGITELDAMITKISQAMGVRTIKGTSRMVGIGITKVAKALWQTAPNVDGGSARYYSSFLVEPLQAELRQMKKSGSTDKIPAMLVMIDAVRAIPYVINGVNEETSFEDYVNVTTLDSSQVRSSH